MNLHSPSFESLKDQLISGKILPVAASRLAGAMSQIVVDAGVEEPERNLSFGDAGFEDPWLSLVFPKVRSTSLNQNGNHLIYALKNRFSEWCNGAW